MREWLCKIICKNLGATNTVAERAFHENSTYDFETKIRDLRRRIKEQYARLEHTQTQSRTTHKPKEVAEQTPNVDQARAAKNAELDAIKAKLMGKKLSS